ncbi:MAG: aromatic ring-hydroxylating dioxygenase subunit alpha, partial [Acidocella sp.]|nr:aromatic ring-hydroxylating dioxygenase subunit alpha [Acidocella sp.]
RIDEQRWTTEIRESITKVFAEDEAVLEAQQRAIDANPDHKFYNLNIDAGSLWARRLIDRMIAAEQAGAMMVAAQ